MRLNADKIMYNDFLSDISIPIEDRFQCETCELWIPKDNTVHTCHCAKQARGEDVSDCKCRIHKSNEMGSETNQLGDSLKKQGISLDEKPEKQANIGLCNRCEYRAQYKEQGHAPRFECGDDGNNSICYAYKPVKPMNLVYPDYGGEYGKINRMRSPDGGYMSARMQADSVAEGEYTIIEKDGVYTSYFVPKVPRNGNSEG